VPSDAVKTAMAKETLGRRLALSLKSPTSLFGWLDDGWAPRWGSFESWATVLTGPLALLCPSAVELLCPLFNSFKRRSVGALGDQVFKSLKAMRGFSLYEPVGED